MPSPADVGPKTAVNEKGDEISLEPKDDGPLAAYVWKTTADPFVGKQTFFRVYSGKMIADDRVWNSAKEEEERLAGMQVPQGKEGIPVDVLHTGDIGLVAKLSVTTTGDTLCEKTNPLTLPAADYPNALYQVAIFPKTQSDAAKLSSTLTRLCEEDMTLSWHNEALMLPSAGRKTNSSLAWTSKSPRCPTRNGSARKTAPCIATRNRPVALASLVKFI
jgi:elongation factor G